VVAAGVQIDGANGLLDDNGAALVVHQSADDLRTDPSGNSGARIRCGVVERP
jgi:Cu-Zn family superoxide dismutase